MLSRRDATFALLAAGAGAANAAPRAGLRDLMPAFWKALDSARGLGPAARAQRLVDGFFTPHAAIYKAAGIGTVDAKRVVEWLGKVEARFPAMRSLHRRFAAGYRGSVRSFARAFPRFDPLRSPIYLMPSLLQFDAHLEPTGGVLPLYFGLDGIVMFHGAAPDLGILFAHETYHCYQAQRNPAAMLPQRVPVYVNLWVEGGATWVSGELNPGASLLSILLDDHRLAEATPAALKAAMVAMRERFDSSADADTGAFFNADYTGAWPARAGYLVGLRIVQQVAPGLGADRFASLPLPEMRTRYRAALEALITG